MASLEPKANEDSKEKEDNQAPLEPQVHQVKEEQLEHLEQMVVLDL